MAIGAGKYDHLCTLIREETRADGVLMLIVNGYNGTGAPCQAMPHIYEKLPDLLRALASEIEIELVAIAARNLRT